MPSHAFAGQVVTLVRGAAQEPPLGAARAVQLSESSASTRDGPGQRNSIYGVPVSAVQHCCGRGCKHCRIYWHKKSF